MKEDVRLHKYGSDEFGVWLAQMNFAIKCPFAVDYSRTTTVKTDKGYEVSIFVRGWHPAYWVIAVWNLWRRPWS